MFHFFQCDNEISRCEIRFEQLDRKARWLGDCDATFRESLDGITRYRADIA